MFNKIDSDIEFPEKSDWFDGNTSDPVHLIGYNEFLNIVKGLGVYDYKYKRWRILTTGMKKVTHWLKEIKNENEN